MCVDNVDVPKAQSLERSLQTLNDVLSRLAVVVDEDLAIDGAPIDFYAM
jgi:hypothetical protein